MSPVSDLLTLAMERQSSSCWPRNGGPAHLRTRDPRQRDCATLLRALATGKPLCLVPMVGEPALNAIIVKAALVKRRFTATVFSVGETVRGAPRLRQDSTG